MSHKRLTATGFPYESIRRVVLVQSLLHFPCMFFLHSEHEWSQNCNLRTICTSNFGTLFASTHEATSSEKLCESLLLYLMCKLSVTQAQAITSASTKGNCTRLENEKRVFRKFSKNAIQSVWRKANEKSKKGEKSASGADPMSLNVKFWVVFHCNLQNFFGRS